MNKTDIIKKIFIIAIILSLLSAFSEYSNSAQNIDDLSYAVAIGIDVGETAKYKISLQLTTMESSATESAISDSSSGSSSGSESTSNPVGSSGDTSSNYIVQTVETDSIDSALNIANSYINKTINLSHCKILLISEEIAKQGVEPLVNSLINKVETRPDCSIIISKIPADEFDSKNTTEVIKSVIGFQIKEGEAV